MSASRRYPAALLAALLVAACATPPDRRVPEARQMIAEGRTDEGLALLRRSMEERPTDPQLRTAYIRERDLAIGRTLTEADNLRISGFLVQAEAQYRRVQRLDALNKRAEEGLESVRRETGYVDLLDRAESALKANDLEAAREGVQRVLAQAPWHRAARMLERRVEEQKVREALASPALSAAALRKTLSVEFRDVPLRSILEVITRATGINFVLDKDIRPDTRATIYVRDQPAGEVIEMLLITQQLAKKVVNESTLAVYPNTPQKQKDYQDRIVKTFYLSNADAKQTLALVRAIVKTQDLFVDEKLGILVMRDSPEAVRLAERLIATQDLAEAEVVLAVEVLEVARSKLLNLGARWPDQVAFSLQGGAPAGAPAGTVGTPGQFTLREWLNRSSDMVRIGVTNPLFTVNLRQQDGDTNLLANPRIRAKNREKARIHIGDRVPVITSTGSATGFVSQSVNYLDVGLKLEVEPTIHLEDEVGIRVALEVSNIVREIRSGTDASGTLSYQIGTRSASTLLRLRDGETQVLAGLISDEDRRTDDRVPGLSDFPVLGRLFSSQKTDKTRSEIVLLITPRIVRSLGRPDAAAAEFRSGTDSSIGLPARAPRPEAR
jgi:general secretion pathway protein D